MEKFSFDGMNDAEIAMDFENAKEHIKLINYLDLITKLIDYYESLAACKGEFLNQEELFERAQEAFAQAKKDNRLDELNSLVF